MARELRFVLSAIGVKKYERVVAEAIDEYDAETKASAGAVLSMMPLAKHDAKYHHGKYIPGSYCKYRELLAEGDEYDRLDPENVEGEAEKLAEIAARRAARAQEKAEKDRVRAEKELELRRRSEEINQKSKEALTREYTVREEMVCDEAMWYAMSGIPALIVSKKDADDIAKKLRKGHRKKNKDVISEFFSEIDGDVGVEGFGPIICNRNSVSSFFAHNRNGFHIPEAVAIHYLKELSSNARIFANNEHWKGRNYDSRSFAVPFTIGDERYVLEFTCDVKNDEDTGDERMHLYNLKVGNIKRMRECFCRDYGDPTVILADREQHLSHHLPLYQNDGSRVNRGRRLRPNGILRFEIGRHPLTDVKGLKEQYLAAMHNPSLLAKQWLAIKYSRALRFLREQALHEYLNSDALEAY